MKLLLENWREYLTEAAKTVEDLPDNVRIAVHTYGTEKATIQYELVTQIDRLASIDSPIKGRVGIMVAPAPCGGAWMVNHALADDGWGPLLYDVAIEWASSKGGGLIPDRRSVSKDARKVWKYYLSNRSDVKSHQLDDMKNTLTPDDEDNCNQAVASKSTIPVIGGLFHRDFASEDNPMSKRYTKEPETLQKLSDAGRLRQT